VGMASKTKRKFEARNETKLALQELDLVPKVRSRKNEIR